jgi:hypothetical protein
MLLKSRRPVGPLVVTVCVNYELFIESNLKDFHNFWGTHSKVQRPFLPKDTTQNSESTMEINSVNSDRALKL